MKKYEVKSGDLNSVVEANSEEKAARKAFFEAPEGTGISDFYYVRELGTRIGKWGATIPLIQVSNG